MTDFRLAEPISPSPDNLPVSGPSDVSRGLAVHAHGEDGLALLAEGMRVLSVATSFEDIKHLRDKAEAVRVFARAANLNLDFQNRAAELKLRAERKAGEVLQKLKLRGGDRKSNSHHDSLKLSDLGITAAQSLRWQRESRIPEEEFCRYIAAARAAGREITAAGLLKLATERQPSRRAARRNTAAPADAHNSGPKVSGRIAADIVTELREHHRLLTEVLQPVCDNTSPLDAPATAWCAIC